MAHFVRADGQYNKVQCSVECVTVRMTAGSLFRRIFIKNKLKHTNIRPPLELTLLPLAEENLTLTLETQRIFACFLIWFTDANS